MTKNLFSDETFFILVTSRLEPDDLGRQGEREVTIQLHLCLGG